MEILHELHLFHNPNNETEGFLFDPESMLFIEVEPSVFEALQRARQGEPLPSEVASQWAEIQGYFLRERHRVRQRSAQFSQGKHVLKRLTILTTTACNLRCTYCYAEGGAYGGPVAHFKSTDAFQALDNILSFYHIIENIQFFGGEPLLNPDLIETVVTFFKEKHQNGEIPMMPYFGVTTNGTIWNAQIAQLVQRYHIALNISLDGPQEIHDALRVDRQGRGSFERVWRTIEALRAQNIPFSVEVTYTPLAMRKGYSVWDILEFLANHGILHPHLVPAVYAPHDPENWKPHEYRQLVEHYREATRRALRALAEGRVLLFSYLTGLLRNLLLRIPQPLICAAGMHDLALDVTGHIYPCFMFIGQLQFRFQSALQSLDNVEYCKQVYDFYLKNAKAHRPSCRTCWARHVCTGCLGWHAIANNGDLGGRTIHCAITYAILETLMIELSYLRKQPKQWERFVHTYRAFRLQNLGQNEVCSL